jgi:pyruvate-formate lyase-activating enzyme
MDNVHHPVTTIGMEVTGYCNARCEFCHWGNSQIVEITNVYSGEKKIRKTGKIDTGLVDDIFKLYPEVNGFLIHGISEPLIGIDRIEYLVSKMRPGMLYSIYTNGHFLDEKTATKLVDMGHLCFLNVSLNATTDEMRQSIEKLPLEPARGNLKRFLEIRDSHGAADKIRVTASMMLTPRNKNHENEFRKMVDGIMAGHSNTGAPGLFLATNWCGAVKNYWMVPAAEQGTGAGACVQWDMPVPVMGVEGDLYLCCYTDKWSFGSMLDRNNTDRWFKRRESYGVDSKHPESYPTLCHGCFHKYTPEWSPVVKATFKD